MKTHKPEDRLLAMFLQRLENMFFLNMYPNTFMDPLATEFEYRSTIIDRLFEMAFGGTAYLTHRCGESENVTIATARATQSEAEYANGPKHDEIVEIVTAMFKVTAVFAEVVAGPQIKDDAKARGDLKEILKAMASALDIMRQASSGKMMDKIAVYGVLIHREFDNLKDDGNLKQVNKVIFCKLKTTYYMFVGRLLEGMTVIRETNRGKFGRSREEWDKWQTVLRDFISLRFRVAFSANMLSKACRKFKGPPPTLELTVTPSKQRSSASAGTSTAARRKARESGSHA
ncbi:hypothetical protein HDU86_003849 [Geranomyces michiganensis]|nr:hypothetical protein HDU86_003849 [Geranomyces michiganensis]